MFIKGNFVSFKIFKKIFYYSNFKKTKLILCDVCPKISKHKIENKYIFLKTLKNMFYFVSFFLKKGGNVVFKSMDYIKQKNIEFFFSYFKTIYKEKLKSSKKHTSEIFYICKNFLYEF